MSTVPSNFLYLFSSSWKRHIGLALITLFSVAACYVPRYRAYQTTNPSQTMKSAEVATVYVYPARGQSNSQLDRDRYECNAWAVKQTGYDPSEYHADAERVNVTVEPPIGTGTAAGALTGAVLGAAVSHPHQEAGGAILGGIAGAMIGASADASRQEEASKIQEAYDRRSEDKLRQAASYRRAISACLESRGYTVK